MVQGIDPVWINELFLKHGPLFQLRSTTWQKKTQYLNHKHHSDKIKWSDSQWIRVGKTTRLNRNTSNHTQTINSRVIVQHGCKNNSYLKQQLQTGKIEWSDNFSNILWNEGGNRTRLNQEIISQHANKQHNHSYL